MASRGSQRALKRLGGQGRAGARSCPRQPGVWGPWTPALPALGLVALVFAFYFPALGAGFVWDDDKYVTENPLLTEPDGWKQIWFSAHTQSQYFPLVYSTFRLEHALWGLHPLGYHLVNVVLHGANAVLVWAVLRRLAVPAAWLGAAIFALHPVQVESVAWVTELKNLESTFFYLLAVLAWMRFVDLPVVSGQWSVVSGQWSVVSGQWTVCECGYPATPGAVPPPAGWAECKRRSMS